MAFVAFVAFVAVAAFPLIEIPQVPDAPEPVVLGTARFVLAVAASEAPVPPSATAKSVMPVIDPPVIDTLLDACVAMVPRPRFVRAVEALARSDRLLARNK